MNWSSRHDRRPISDSGLRVGQLSEPGGLPCPQTNPNHVKQKTTRRKRMKLSLNTNLPGGFGKHAARIGWAIRPQGVLGL